MKTATNEATTTPATAPAADKAPSKMEKCQALYNEIFKPGYDLGGKSQRAVFIFRAQAELEMTKNGANTYYQNLSNAARGLGKYRYNKYEGKKGSKAETGTTAATTAKVEEAGADLPGGPAVTKAAIKAAEKQASKTTKDLTQRWQVLDDGEVVDSFSTRAAAKKAATGGLVMKDAKAS